METQSGIKWTAVIWAAVLMFIIPFLISFLIVALYPTYVGFSTRGDPAQINAAVQAVGGSIVYQVIVYAAYAVVALWRGYVLAKKGATQPWLHVILAAVIALLLVFGLNFVMSGGDLTGILQQTLLVGLMLVGGACLGSLLKPSNTAPA